MHTNNLSFIRPISYTTPYDPMDSVIGYIVPEVESWMPINDYIIPGIQPYYFVSNRGRVWSNIVGGVMLLAQDTNGYLSIKLMKRDGSEIRVRVHRLVMLAFNYIYNANHFLVNHKSGVKTKNAEENLEWATHSENNIHAYATGLRGVGEDHFSATYTNEQVHIICKALSERVPFKDIVTLARLVPDDNDNNVKHISDIKNKITWIHISSQYDIPSERTSQLFTDSEIHQICKLMEQGLKNPEIIKTLRFDLVPAQWQTTMMNIRSRRRFGRISKNYKF